ncbi:UDP-2,3-diacylglucosamine diphosphatase [Alysiella crassa]|uniref:UDP-2,3-diacylglucosamine hydrolase n=1 Tax=Alysiella crassa TaxID=153491 RepID=A0A376BNC2_9NEIS|nr:UDP-2,3-diacylglucosamine diphosphatase [Alysiella crassa]UOP06725.1 UDP-2,3-diacylglucosamine diphosphatase [Alysiella crassa]SSY71168.1 UDP-2,3-diacylglucosamine hydrolase [Alysiella crassa]
MQTLFIADLHLSDHTPSLNALFARFLREQTGKVAALYILGDLFEAWTGDDDDSQTAQQVAEQIRDFAQFAPVYFIAGNRDFVLGKQYASRANMQILPEQSMISLHGKRILLTHGDELCTDDVQYLRYRKIIRNPLLLKILLCLPFRKRKQIAEQIRSKSRQRKLNEQNYAISDATASGIQAACEHNRALDVLIHGHTHRQNIHYHQIFGREIARYVLPDWYDDVGGYLAVDEQGFAFHTLLS